MDTEWAQWRGEMNARLTALDRRVDDLSNTYIERHESLVNRVNSIEGSYSRLSGNLQGRAIGLAFVCSVAAGLTGAIVAHLFGG